MGLLLNCVSFSYSIAYGGKTGLDGTATHFCECVLLNRLWWEAGG